MRCRHISDLASRYLSRELTAAKMSAVEAHLAKCETCRAEFEAMARSISALKQPRRTFEPPDVLAAVKMEAAQPVRLLKPAFAGWAFAGIAVAVLVVWFGMSRERVPTNHQEIVKSPAPIRHVAPEPVISKPSHIITATNPKKEHRAVRTHTTKPQKTEPQESELFPEAQDGTIEYLIVYTPEPPAESPDLPPTEMVVPAPMNESYSISMTDPEAGKVTTVSMQRETAPDSELKLSIGYEVKDIKNDERSLLDEKIPVPDNCIADTCIG